MKPTSCTVSIKVRYVECDPMGYLHHSHYLPYFEIGRTELLRQCGMSYKDVEEMGIFFVVAKVSIQYKLPARYDDDLELVTKITRQTAVRIEHAYEIYNAKTRLLLCTAQTTLACVGRDGQIRAIPDELSPEAT